MAKGTPLVNVRLDEARRAALEDLATQMGLSRSDVLRVALDRLAQEERGEEQAA